MSRTNLLLFAASVVMATGIGFFGGVNVAGKSGQAAPVASPRTVTIAPPAPKPGEAYLPTFSLGEAVTVPDANGGVFLAEEFFTVIEFQKAIKANDTAGLGELMRRGAVFQVEKGAQLKVIDQMNTPENRLAYRFRVTDGKKAGTAGWADSLFFMRIAK